jgi:hypothetical protein
LKVRKNNFAPTGRSGVFDYFNLIYRNADHQAYIPAMMGGKAEDDPDNPYVYDSKGNVRTEKQRRAYYRNHWRPQMSDHLTMWLGSTTTRTAGGLDFTGIGGKRQGREVPQSLKTTRWNRVQSTWFGKPN